VPQARSAARTSAAVRERDRWSARDVLDVDARALAQLLHHVGIAAPALERELAMRGVGGIAERQRGSQRHAPDASAPGVARSRSRHRAAGLGQLERDTRSR
jgi:hypothetical protein